MTQTLTEPARKDLVRSVPFTLARADASGDGLTLDGYAAVFDSPTRIDSWEGCFDEQIRRGAFKRSLAETPPVIQFDHGTHPTIGSIPIGSLQRAEEDSHGLHVIARLHDNWLIEPVRDAIASRSVNGMSFRFEALQDEWRDAEGNLLTDERDIRQGLSGMSSMGVLSRTLINLRCRELGPVVFPAYADTSVGVRSVTIDLGRLHEPDQRRELARAVWMAERATAQDGTEQAADHATPDTQQATDEAGEHESTPAAEPPGLRSNLGRFLRTRGIVVENAIKKEI